MDWMRSCWAISGFSSILILTSFTAPPAASTAASSEGPSVLQGPHHGAQKSTITGVVRLCSRTSAAKVARPESLICGLLPVALFWAGWEVSGRPPGPINAIGKLSGSFLPETWSFGTQNESPPIRRRGRLRHQLFDPLRQGEGGGMDGRVVVVRLQPG